MQGTCKDFLGKRGRLEGFYHECVRAITRIVQHRNYVLCKVYVFTGDIHEIGEILGYFNDLEEAELFGSKLGIEYGVDIY
jgi:hypothetical protein